MPWYETPTMHELQKFVVATRACRVHVSADVWTVLCYEQSIASGYFIDPFDRRGVSFMGVPVGVREE